MKKIPLTQGQFALIDDVDFDLVINHKWCACYRPNCRGYIARTRINGKQISMHRFLMDSPINMEVDHINHNGLDNQRKNLRICTFAQNRMNIQKHILKWGYKGISWIEKSNKWKAQIKINKKTIHIGTFLEKMDAVKAYNQKSKELFGEFSNPNEY